MNKKLLIFVVSALTILTVALGVIGVIIYNEFAPKDPTADYTGALEHSEDSDGGNRTNITQPKNPNKTSDPSIEVTEVYEFYNAFKAPEYKQSTYRDKESGITLPYCIIEPKNYSPDKKYPVLLYLHGAGETGTDNVAPVLTMQDAFLVNGDLLSDVIIVCPQSTSWWNVNSASGDKKGPVGAAVRLLDSLGESYSIDENRIYVIGISMGGYGTWDALSHFPDKFAAGIPICGGGSSNYANALKNIPIWVYHGTADSVVPFAASENMYDAIKASGGNKIHFTRLQGVNHNCWTTALADRELFSWLLSQNKLTNKSGDYKLAVSFKITDQNGNTIVDDNYASEPFFHYYNGYVLARFNLTDKGLERLNAAYKNGGELTLIHGNQRLLSFKGTDIEPTNKFEIDTKYIKQN